MNFKSKSLSITFAIIVSAGLGISLLTFKDAGDGRSPGKSDPARVQPATDQPGDWRSRPPGLGAGAPEPEPIRRPVKGKSASAPESTTFFNDDPDLGISATLETISSEHGWSESALIENKSLWNNFACDAVRNYADSPMSADELARVDARMLAGKRLATICRNLSDEAELATLDSFLGDGVSDNVNRTAVANDIKETLESLSREEALREAGSEIRAALERNDEALVQEIVSLLAFDEGVLNSFLDSELNYLPAYQNVIQEVASSLMCEWNGGCTGNFHPYVLRQCVRRNFGVGAFCYRPNNIEQAIYQTLTPLEFAAYNAFLNQVRAHLTTS